MGGFCRPLMFLHVCDVAVESPFHVRDQIENFLAYDRQLCGVDFRADTTGATHRTEMTQQTEACHICTGANKAAEKAELFDLAADPNETSDLAAKMPEKVAALRTKLAELSKADRDALADD